jgi:hypothetical protein
MKLYRKMLHACQAGKKVNYILMGLNPTIIMAVSVDRMPSMFIANRMEYGSYFR